MCMVARGVEKHASSTVTMGARGACQHDAALRSSLLQQLTHRIINFRDSGVLV